MKILFSPTKQMNFSNLIKRKNDINIQEVNDNIDYLKSLTTLECYDLLKTKDNYYDINQNINVLSKKAINLYKGISFKQLTNINNDNYQNLLILSALYGYSYAFDYISPYRFDYTMKESKKNYQIFCNRINDLISGEDIVYNLASNEFSKDLKHHNMINFIFYLKKDNKLVQHSVSSKKMRGQLANYIINNKNIDLESFNYDNFYFDDTLSRNN
ncbi:MAG: YaaA family protein, partial [Bacilli bacterium]|nr:YaaA family protein [Bacilli bacterium]